MKFFMVSIGIKNEEYVDHSKLQKDFDKLKDWVKFHYNQYIVMTSIDSTELYNIVRNDIPASATALVIELNAENRQGIVPKVLADWLKSDHSGRLGL